MKKGKLNKEQKERVKLRIAKLNAVKQEQLKNNLTTSAKMTQKSIDALNEWL